MVAAPDMAARVPAVSERRWVVAPAVPVDLAAQFPHLHPVAVQVLYNRGLTAATQINAFLEEDTLYDPLSLYGMDRAIERLRIALMRGEHIAVHGDSDVDGVAAAVVLTEGLRAAGATVTPLVPSRLTMGYGLQASTVERLAENGVSLIVTGDTGTRALDAVERAAQLGVDVIITDHHLPGEVLPAAWAIVNPHQAACSYPAKELAGCGVAWKLICALASERLLPDFDVDSLLDLVALGTIADVSPMVGENRRLVQRGLRRLGKAPRVGIRALLDQSASAGSRPTVDERTVAFSIAPRLNAAGRMDNPAVALELLLTHSEPEARENVQRLEALNVERQQLTERVLGEARRQVEGLAQRPLLFLQSEHWPSGVIGLVAARLAEEYRRPVFVVDVQAGTCRGSGRSIAGFDLVQALEACADLLLEYGGHALAAGFSVLPVHLEALGERLLAVRGSAAVASDHPVVADYALDEAALDWELHGGLGRLRPYGSGNAQPLFLTTNVRLVEARPVGGGGQHLRARLRFGQQVLTAFGPHMGPRAAALRSGQAVDALYAVDASTWNGRESLEIRLEDVRPARTRDRR
jgi:single-stranded-DNA-specific exonuclease